MKQLTAAFAVAAALSAALTMAPKPAAAAGADTFEIGAATGTAIVLVSATPATYYGVTLSSPTAGDFVKCWKASSIAGLTLSTEANLLDNVVASSRTFTTPSVAPVALNADPGLACAKSAPGVTAVVRFNK